MKVRMTFTIDDAERRAIALAMGTKRPATRTQAVQFLTGAVEEQLAPHLRELRRRAADPDPHQAKLPSMEPVYEQ